MRGCCAGVDVPALFSRVGIEVGNTGERVGTFAIAYAAHKALSPVRRCPCMVWLCYYLHHCNSGGCLPNGTAIATFRACS